MMRFAVLSVVSLLNVAGPALAQQSPNPPNPPATTSAAPAGAPTNPDLAVAQVKMLGGLRVSKLIGSKVYNDQDQAVGSLDDLIMKDGNTVVMAVVSVGGFLGIGNKLVAVPYDQLHLKTDEASLKVVLPGANKDALNAMPTFTYSG
jgi:hypothetical protein